MARLEIPSVSLSHVPGHGPGVGHCCGVTGELPLVRTAPVLTFNCSRAAGGGRALRRGCAGQRENLRVRGGISSPAASTAAHRNQRQHTRPGSEEEAYTGTHYRRRLAFDARMRQKIKTAFVTPASGGNIKFDSWQLPFISVRRIHL